jgi:HK97 family phage major capsid protein
MADTSVLEALRKERNGLVEEAEGLMQADNFDPSDPVLVETRSKIDNLDTKIKSLTEWAQRRASQNEIDAISIKNRVEQDAKADNAEYRSLGQMFVESRAYADYRNAPRGSSGRVDVPLLGRQERAVIGTGTYAGLIQPTRIRPSEAPNAQTPLLNRISQIQVQTNSVEWIFYSAAAPLAGVVAEGTPKPEAAVAPVLKTVTLNTVAHWVQYTRQFQEDAAGLADFLNSSLIRGVNDKREALAATALTGSADIPVVPNAGTLLEGIRMAIGQVTSAGYAADVVILNPMDYAALDIDLLGRTLNGAVIGSQFWGVSPVAVGAVPSGTAFVADIATAMAELVRTDVSVYTTDSDITGAGATAASAFRANILTTLAEARTAPIVHRPEAAAKVTGTVVVAAEAQTAGRK